MSALLIDLTGQDVSQEELELLAHPLVAGVILFTRNFYDREQIQHLIATLRHKVKKPLLITVDQEGGRVQRFREGFTQLPAMQSFAQLIRDPAEQKAMALEAGWQMAAEMTALDIDLSFAPVLDLGHQCRAIGDRSFHDEAEQTVELARNLFLECVKQEWKARANISLGTGECWLILILKPLMMNAPKRIFSRKILCRFSV